MEERADLLHDCEADIVLWVGRYNMSYVVQQSAVNGKPVLGISINYRLSAFGFLDS